VSREIKRLQSEGVNIEEIIVHTGQHYDKNEAIEKEKDCILFLTHPNHWFYDSWKRGKKVIKSLLFGHKKENQVFRRI